MRVLLPSAGQVTDVAYFGATELAELQLAWATTVHKAQGAEFKAVVLVLAPQHRVLLNRRLLYTGGSALGRLFVLLDCNRCNSPRS